MKKKDEIMVFIEHHAGKIAQVSIELLYEAGRMAAAMDWEVTATAAGSGLSQELAGLGHYGCSRVYYTEDRRLAGFTSLPVARSITETIRRHKPRIVLYGATSTGRAVAPRIASALKKGLTADCTGLKIGDCREKGRRYRNILYQIRPAFGGNIIATIISPESVPSMATVRPGVMKLGTPDPAGHATVILEPDSLTDADFPTEILQVVEEEKRVNLTAARIIVSAGMGAASSPESLELVKELARMLGGALGASRPVVDSGILPKEHQVGQTGTTVRPTLYIACGISGQIQHRAGMAESKRIIAVNTDPEAPIFKIAHYGIVGDVRVVLPKMIKSYREETGEKKMVNFYTDNPDLQFHLETGDLERIIDLKEDGFSERDTYTDAPANGADALDNYRRVIEVTGEIAGEYISPDAAAVDARGAQWYDGKVSLAPETLEAVKRLRQADLLGMTLPRQHGGLNFPKTVYSMAIEIISRADASLMTIFGLQEICETICRFGSEDQCRRYLPRFASGEVTGAMALTEPESGSDLPSVRLKATEDEKGIWRLEGTKRFITNGCGDIVLVLARSEEDMDDARGLSLFIYERDENVAVRRIEEKYGIRGSPTCELQFTGAEAELLGKRKFGLIKYTMSLMNGARLAVAAQAVGISEAACREAAAYAAKRSQFGRLINTFPPVYEMLTDMRVNTDAARTLLYEAARRVDRKEGLERRIELHPETKPELRKELRRNTQFAELLTPMVKYYAAERGNRTCYDALQVHGGVGFTCGFPMERLCRDVRITSIYEGTSQIQVIAAMAGIAQGKVFDLLEDYELSADYGPVEELIIPVRGFREILRECVTAVMERDLEGYVEYHSRRLVDMAADTVIGYLLCRDALRSERKRKTAALYIAKARPRVAAAAEFILSGDSTGIDLHEDFI